MIKMGFNTLAMLTLGLGIRLPWPHSRLIFIRGVIDFVDKPSGIEAEDLDTGISYDRKTVSFEEKAVTFKE